MKYMYSELIEDTLDRLIENNNILNRAMRYSLLCGGKRIRPTLMIEFFKLISNDDIDNVLPYACALEMIHTYSLIHDDLPCMDNDNLRRGKPSNHIAYGEDIALLAGDGLLTLAFETALNPDYIVKIGNNNAMKAIYTLSKCCGTKGMILGQVIDLENENEEKPTLKSIIDMYDKKTSQLLIAATVMGVQLAGGTAKQADLAYEYGEKLGLSFQIVDDILDITANQDELGKPIGSDLENDKSTYVSIVGIEKAKEEVNKLTGECIDILNKFSSDITFLKNLTIELQNRTK